MSKPSQHSFVKVSYTAMVFIVILCLSGCSVGRFQSDAEFDDALRRSQYVIGSLDKMPTSNLARLASSATMRMQWEHKANRVFENTGYLGAKIIDRSYDEMKIYHLSALGGTSFSIGKGRPVAGGYLGKGHRRTKDYSGPAYVYRRSEGPIELQIFIAAGQIGD